jgi:TolA-binding protein
VITGIPDPGTNTLKTVNKPQRVKKVTPKDSRTPSTSRDQLSLASKLMIKACNNYLHINPESPKTPEVLLLNASIYYNNKLFDKSREIYQDILDNYPQSPENIKAIRMIAQSYYEEDNYNKAQDWFRKLKDRAYEESSKSEAVTRIAESIFRIAEKYEKEQRYADAAAQYERISSEFPDVAIADKALFNAGLAYEKEIQWSKAILMYERLKKRHKDSKLIPKSMFRAAKCYEKLEKWDDAAQTYLRLVANFPSTKSARTSLHNAGFCFENNGKYIEAASTFEKLAQSFPKSKDAADVLFKASELYGKINDWEGMTRVNKEFSKRYGNDKDRIVQAQCMLGVALYMQNNEEEALEQLKKAASTFKSLNNPSTVNKYYAAKALFTIGDIYLANQNKIKLIQPKKVYQSRLNEKSDYLSNAVEAYSSVLDYGISEWTTRAIFQIGQSYEDFAFSVFKQQRPRGISLEKSLSLEMSIAKAVEQYFVDNSLQYHEQNVKLGIKEKVENESIINSKKKLTYLPFIAGKNFIALVDIAEKLEAKKKLVGFALIGQKLQILQKMAPFQERAIGLFLKCLEMGARYKEYNDFYKEASSLITKTSFTVAKTYSDVAEIARSAPIPKNFDAYEEFVYKTKLLKQIEEYDESALANYMKVLKISQAYDIKDKFVEKTKYAIPKLLFTRARCYDLLCISAFTNPPYPKKTNEAEKAEYRAQFEEIGLNYQEHAFEIYRAIFDYAKQDYATGDYVNHAYARLYQNFPEEFGFKVKGEKITSKTITSGPQWKCSPDSTTGWYSLEFNDQNWIKASEEELFDIDSITGFPDKPPAPIWCKYDGQKAGQASFRRVFYISEPPHSATLTLAAINKYTVYLNENRLPNDKDSQKWNNAQSWDLSGKLRKGKNVLAIYVTNDTVIGYGLYPYLSFTITDYDYLPKFPGAEEILDKKDITEDTYMFPGIKNFSMNK